MTPFGQKGPQDSGGAPHCPPFALKGTLVADSLGLWQQLPRVVGPEAQARLGQLYSALWAAGLVSEPETERLPGASFNPRPARLVAIVLKEAPAAGVAQFFEAALIMGASALPASETLEGFEEPLQLALLAQSFSHEPGASLSSASPEVALLIAIRALDDLRHFHQHRAPLSQSAERVSHFSKLVSSLAPGLRAPRILVLLEAALRRAQVRVSSEATS